MPSLTPSLGPSSHRQPRDDSPSSFVAKYAEEIARKAPGCVLDVACGYGRNAARIVSYGVPVVCLDHDRRALAFIEARNGEASGTVGAMFKTRCIDLGRDAWPYKSESVGAIVSVHWSFDRMVDEFVSTLKPGGLLLLETIGGQGTNYRSLPKLGFFRTALSDAFEIRYLEERIVGPKGSNAAAAKVFAVKRVGS